jgi:predicted RNA-binding protein (virulence factor B family)
LLVVEKLHRDLSTKYDASRAETARLQVLHCMAIMSSYNAMQQVRAVWPEEDESVQVELAAQRAAAATAATTHEQQMDALQREHITMLMHLASMIRGKGAAINSTGVTTRTGPVQEMLMEIMIYSNLSVACSTPT